MPKTVKEENTFNEKTKSVLNKMNDLINIGAKYLFEDQVYKHSGSATELYPKNVPNRGYYYYLNSSNTMVLQAALSAYGIRPVVDLYKDMYT